MSTSNAGRVSRAVAASLLVLLPGCAAPDTSGEPVAEVEPGHEYAFAVLTVGPRASELDEEAVAAASAGHRAHIESMGAEGTLLLAGPFGAPRAEASWQGLYVFDLPDIDEAYELAGADPSIVAGLFDVVIVPWQSDVDLRPMRDRLERDKAEGAAFVPAAYVLAIGEASALAREALAGLEADGMLICGGELGGERAGQLLLFLSAETVEEAREWLSFVDATTEWELSSLWATALLGELAADGAPSAE